MKGRTTCPKCKHQFVVDVPDDKKTHKVTCPKCEKNFTIKTDSCDTKKDGECSWEEHGEPRKTILSKIKPRTNKPLIAFILLIIVFCFGISTAVFSETFIAYNSNMANSLGLRGTLKMTVIDPFNDTIGNAILEIENNEYNTDSKGAIVVENVELGIQTVKIYKPESDFQTITREILILPFFSNSHEITLETGDDANVSFDTIGCTLIFGLFSVFALIGAISCFRRKNFDVAVAGSIIGIFTFGLLFIGSILSIIAFFLIIKCKEEFDDGKKGKIF